MRMLLEREAELARIAALLDREEGALVLLIGSPGIGRTSLLAAVRTLAAERGFDARSARGAEAERELEYGVARQLLGPGDGGLDALHRLAVERAPLALLVDDADRADAASLRAVAYLAGRLTGLRALVVAAARSEPPVLASEPAAHVLRPATLSQAAVAELVGPDLAAAVVESTGGNPFLVAALADELARGAPARAVAPASVARWAFGRLSEAGAELARATAILGDGAELAHAAALAGLDPAVAGGAADELVAADVLRHERRLAFVHPLVRTAIYADVPPHRRGAAHRRAAQALADGGAASARVADHLLHAPPDGDAWVVDVLRTAAREDPERAVAYLERAVAEPPGDRPGVLGELGSAELRAGHPGALEHLGAALRDGADPVARAHSALELGRALVVGRRAEAASLLAGAAAEVRPVAPELAARLEVEAIAVERIFGLAGQDRRLRLLALSEEVEPDTPPGRLVLAALAFETAIAGTSADEGGRLAARAFGGGSLLAEEGPESPSVIMAANALAFCERFAQARGVLERGLAAARAGGSPVGAAFCSCFLSALILRLGAVAEAEALARAAVAACGAPGLDVLRPIAVSFLVDALIERGAPDDAERALADGELAGIGPDDMNAMFMVVTRGRLRVVRGEREQGLADLLEAGERLLQAGVANAAPTFWRSRAALALLALGDRGRALELAGEEVAIARRFGAPSALGFALASAGVVTPGEDGVALLREALAVLEPSPARLEHTRALVSLGGALRRAGRTSEAREPLGAALAGARALGATALAQRAYEELTATGARPRKILRTGPDQLTAAERRVAEMAAQGLGNRDIAQALFVTVRTVETHLSHVYRKLGIHSRRALRDILKT